MFDEVECLLTRSHMSTRQGCYIIVMWEFPLLLQKGGLIAQCIEHCAINLQVVGSILIHTCICRMSSQGVPLSHTSRVWLVSRMNKLPTDLLQKYDFPSDLVYDPSGADLFTLLTVMMIILQDLDLRCLSCYFTYSRGFPPDSSPDKHKHYDNLTDLSSSPLSPPGAHITVDYSTEEETTDTLRAHKGSRRLESEDDLSTDRELKVRMSHWYQKTKSLV